MGTMTADGFTDGAFNAGWVACCCSGGEWGGDVA